jgi:hypothetical protein
MSTPLLDQRYPVSAYAAQRAAEEEAREHNRVLELAWRILARAIDMDDALLLLDAILPAGDDPKEICRELKKHVDENGHLNLPPVTPLTKTAEPWTLDRMTKLVLGHAAIGAPFSANHFYLTLPEDAHPLIGPAIQKLRHRYFETLGTEIAISPSRKGSRVTVYRLRPGVLVLRQL